MKKIQKREFTAWLFLLPSFVGTLIFTLIPFGDVIRRSFLDAMGNQFVGVLNYKNVLQNGAFQLAIKNTARFVVTCIPLLLLLSLILCILIVGRKKHGDFFKATYLFPMAIPVASVVLLWRVIFDKSGLINEFLLSFNMQPVDFMNTSKAFYVLVFSYIWKNTGYDMVLWLAGLNGIPTSLYEAASIDGANGWQKFKYITLPGLRSTLYITLVLSLINSFKVFREVYLVAGDYPNNSIYMLQHLFNNWFLSMDIQKMSAAAVMLAVTFLLLILLLSWLEKRWEGDYKKKRRLTHKNENI
ncbi:carbohydrate ABC transporter permease [Anaerosacchariphilus polymeriproducens]|uniref:Sugar ABC transporter permease n=1 Tax=Anaerosacchariphilus polymeriproducens TaxID=1812858 RepID=A0A371ARU4_9FIRM|nr:sugar ABC transporter permease [Anaerosacchariphilus polymeriproducens]RDU22274.1 sugar ABC transporter permease [Anaerosacchariphilus polymeriproducens]